MFLHITGEYFRFFLDGTGKAFTVFMDSLLRATSAKSSIPPSDVHTNLRTNLADGGVDTQIDSGNNSVGYLTGPTIWQFKARKFCDITSAAIREEIHGESKQDARDLIRKGYAYRLCICEDAPPPDKKALQDELDRCVKEINSSSPPALILLSSDLADWVNQYPTIVARYLQVPVEKFRWHETWRASAIGETRIFVPPEHYADWKSRVETHLDWSRKPNEVALTLYGNAGVGKTRSLFEILDRQVDQRELVLYTNDEKSAIEIATALTNDGTQNAILVADECLARARFRLAQILLGNENRIRLITIDNALERTRTLAAEVHISGATESETLKVLEANFDQVPLDRRIRYTRIANGSLRFAVYMCLHDSEIQESGNISSALADAHSYYESRFAGQFGFDSEDRKALEIVALVDRVGYRDEHAGELDALCNLTGKDPRDVRERLERIRKSMGFVASAGRYYYVTPAPVAMVAFESAWDHWVANDPYRFLKGLPEDLVQPFQDRVSSASPEVGAIVARFFRDWTISQGARILDSESDTRHLVALVAADPATQIPLLRGLIESASVLQLRRGDNVGFPYRGSTTRRLLVSLAEEIAQFSEFFFDAEAILFRLSVEEIEPSIGNNATSTWKGLFRILLSGTEVPFKKRFDLLKQRGADKAASVRELVVSAAAAAVDRQPFRMVGAPLFGSRVPPQDWRPKTHEDYRDAIEDCMALLVGMTSDADQGVATAATKALFEATSQLLWAGYIEPVRKALEGRVADDLKPRIRSLVREVRSRVSWKELPAESRNPEIKAGLEDWLASLETGTLHAQLIENVGSEPWSHHFDEEEWRKSVDNLAQQLYADPIAFAKELSWLNSDEAKSAAELGYAFGTLDAQSQRHLTQVIDEAIRLEATAFARGYVYSLAEHSQAGLSRLNQELDRVQNANAKVAFYIMLPAGDAVRSFGRALAMVGTHQIPPRLLSNLQVWIGNRKTTPIEAGQAIRSLLSIVENDTRDIADVAVDFVAYQVNGVSAEEKSGVLSQVFGDKIGDLWTLLDLFVSNPGREDFWFSRVLRAATDIDPARGCDIATRMIVGSSFSMEGEGEKLIEELLQIYPVAVMESLGRRLTEDESKNQFFLRKFSFLASVPFDVAKEWLGEVGVVGARAIARHLPPPYLTKTGQPEVPPLTEYVLTQFEDDQRTFSEFVAGVHSLQGYWGSFSEARQKEADAARAFLNHRAKRIREWALLEVRQGEEDARVHGIREDERGM
jgi:hypothetical protein